MNCEYVRETYGVSAEIGRRIKFDGKPGIIAEDMGAYIGILMDDAKPSEILPAHPRWNIEYLDEIGVVRKQTKAQLRYKLYKEMDCFDSFRDFLLWESKRSAS